MATVITYSLTITLVRVSILLLYRRIFDTAGFRRKSLMVGSACVIWLVVTILINLLQCRPFTMAFELAMLFTDHCIDVQAWYLGICVSTLVLDMIVLSLPIQEVWKLQLPRQKKVVLTSIFMLSGL